MTLGHYLWRNDDGSEFDLDVDSLPTTEMPPNVPLGVPLMIVENPGEPDHGQLFKSPVPNFRLEPINDGSGGFRIYHSLNTTETDYENNPIGQAVKPS